MSLYPSLSVDGLKNRESFEHIFYTVPAVKFQVIYGGYGKVLFPVLSKQRMKF